VIGLIVRNFTADVMEKRTISVVEITKGFIFRGYTPVSWDSSSGKKCDDSMSRSIFTLNAIFCCSDYYLAFGGGHDFRTYPDAATTTSNYSDIMTGEAADELRALVSSSSGLVVVLKHHQNDRLANASRHHRRRTRHLTREVNISSE
jgi:hypothetical protein